MKIARLPNSVLLPTVGPPWRVFPAVGLFYPKKKSPKIGLGAFLPYLNFPEMLQNDLRGQWKLVDPYAGGIVDRADNCWGVR